MNEIKIEDYLHLYLGCECRVSMVGSNSRFHEYEGDKIFEPLDLVEALRGDMFLKLRLRPLSDMTEEDHKKCKDFRWRYIHSRKIAYEDQYSQLVPEEFIYLLKQGFDLFGLIEAGLAINNLTVTSKD